MERKSLDDSSTNSFNPNTPGMFGEKFSQEQSNVLKTKLSRRYRHEKYAVFQNNMTCKIESMIKKNLRDVMLHSEDDEF